MGVGAVQPTGRERSVQGRGRGGSQAARSLLCGLQSPSRFWLPSQCSDSSIRDTVPHPSLHEAAGACPLAGEPDSQDEALPSTSLPGPHSSPSPPGQ